MKPASGILLLFFAILLTGCAEKKSREYSAASPDGQLTASVFLTPEGVLAYELKFENNTIIDTSLFGFSFKNGPELKAGLEITGEEKSNFSETWKPAWGPDSEVKNEYNQLKINVKEKAAPGRMFSVVFKVFNDGLGFRYEFPQQDGWQEALIDNEMTEFQLTGDHFCWWAPGDWDIYEHLYTESPLSQIDCTPKLNHPNLAQTYIPDIYAVNTPLTMKTADGLYLSFHEAALYDYSDMTLHIDRGNYKMTSALVGGPNEYKVKRALPFNTPWRTIQVGKTAGALIESHLIENLNEPSKIAETGWIKPAKYVGIWWEMHLNKATWGMAGGKHGATTANAKKYIDFAAANGIAGLLVEGWNTGWEQWLGDDREGIFDFVTPYPDFDIKEVVRYGKEKGVELIGHHETSAAVLTYERQMDTAFQFYHDLGVSAVKTGYVGKISPKGEYHHGQWMVNHYQKVVELAAKYQIMIDAHEPIKDTGIRRTWPNFVSREGARGQEFNCWSKEGSNYTNHVLIVPFTRGLGGPFDYTPGVFNITLKPYKPDNQIPHTLAKELSLYVLIYSPVQMACDLPEYYEQNMAAFQFIKDVAVDWDYSKVLEGEPGQFLTMVRKAKGADSWFVGAATNEQSRTTEVTLDWLPEGKEFTAKIYADGADADWKTNPTSIVISEKKVKKGDTIPLTLASGGGAAISIQ